MKGILKDKGGTAVDNTAALLKQAKEGNAAAFGALYALYAEQAYAYACAILKNTHAAEDAVQETCIKVYKGVRNIRNSDAFKAYFFKTLSNTAKTLLRRSTFCTVGEEITDSAPAPENTAQTAELRTDLAAALDKLTDEERQIVLLSAVAGLSSKEIADAVGLTAGAVRSKLSRSLQKLRTYLS